MSGGRRPWLHLREAAPGASAAASSGLLVAGRPDDGFRVPRVAMGLCGPLAPRVNWAVSRVRVRVPIAMDVAERRATSDLTRRRRDYSSRVKLFYWLVSYKDASCLALPCPALHLWCTAHRGCCRKAHFQDHQATALSNFPAPKRRHASLVALCSQWCTARVVVHRSRRRCRKSSI